MTPRQLVPSALDAVVNIRRYGQELINSAELRRRIGNVSAWYAVMGDDGEFFFAPSKFAGYASLNAQSYLSLYGSGLNGQESERRLSKWFDVLPADAPLAKELRSKLEAMAARFGRPIKKTARINLLKSEIARHPVSTEGIAKLASRIVIDPEICGGRPRIRGTRMRISDILDLMAAGVPVPEILADYPHLTGQDIAAALDYAARALDHRVIRAA